MSEVVFRPVLKRFEPLWNSKGYRHIVLAGGRSSAKSWAVAQVIVRNARKYRCLIMCTRMVQISIKQSSKRLIEDLIRKYCIEDEFEILRDSITHRVTGSEIMFRGMQDVRSLEGVDICWIEEAQNVSEERATELIPTIRKRGSVILWTLNPMLPTDYVSKRFLEAPEREGIKVIRVNITDLPNEIVSPEIFKEMEQDFLDNPKRARHTWLGEYKDATDRKLASMSALIEAMQRTAKPEGAHILGFDVGGGGDDSVLTDRQGNYIHGQWAFSEADPHTLCSLVAKQVRATAPPASTIYYDSGGIGWAIGTILEGLLPDYIICPVNFGSSPIGKSSNALNRRAEMAQNAVDAIRAGLSLKNTRAGLIEQIMAIDCYENTAGKLQLSSKDDVRKLIGRSTDDFDSLMLCYAGGAITEVYAEIEQYSPILEDSESSWMS